MDNRMKMLLVVAVLAVAAAYLHVSAGFNLSPTSKAAGVMQSDGGTASISMSFYPARPKISENVGIVSVVSSSKTGDFILEIGVFEKEKMNRYQSYQFSLGAGDSRTFVTNYTYTDPLLGILSHTIAANLYDANKTVMYDSKIAYFNVQSETGLDINTEHFTNFISPGGDLPFSITIGNAGSRDLVTDLIVDISCFNVPDIVKNFSIPINASSKADRNLILHTCGDEGLHTVTTSLFYLGEKQTRTSFQYYEKKGLQSLDFLVPGIISAPENGAREIAIIFGNSGNESASNIRPIVFGTPSSWFSITPSFISDIKSGELSLVVVNFTPPQGTMGSYPLFIGASGDNLYSSKVVELRVTGAAAMPLAETASIIIAAGLSITVAATIVYFAFKKRPERATFQKKEKNLREELKKDIMERIRNKLKEKK